MPSGSELPPMRRIIAGHDERGSSTVLKDTRIPASVYHGTGCNGLSTGALWSNDKVPATDNNTNLDGAERRIEGTGLVVKNGTNCQFTDLAPGGCVPMHRTSSIDYNVLVAGKLILILDDGSELVVDEPGSMIVMKGNIHAWRNPGPTYTRWVTVLVDAEPAQVNGEVLGDAWKV